MNFGEFHETWRHEVGPTLPSEAMRDQYMREDDGAIGFELISTLSAEDMNHISMILAIAIEESISQSETLDKMDFARHRMIHDRHMIRLMAADFDEDFHNASVERSLFMIYHRIPLIWIFSAFNLAKNRIIKEFHKEDPIFEIETSTDLMCAITTLFMIELNSIGRVYSYFGLRNNDESYNFVPPKIGHVRVCMDLGLQDRNSQISPPKVQPIPALELF